MGAGGGAGGRQAWVLGRSGQGLCPGTVDERFERGFGLLTRTRNQVTAAHTPLARRSQMAEQRVILGRVPPPRCHRIHVWNSANEGHGSTSAGYAGHVARECDTSTDSSKYPLKQSCFSLRVPALNVTGFCNAARCSRGVRRCLEC